MRVILKPGPDAVPSVPFREDVPRIPYNKKAELQTPFPKKKKRKQVDSIFAKAPHYEQLEVLNALKGQEMQIVRGPRGDDHTYSIQPPSTVSQEHSYGLPEAL